MGEMIKGKIELLKERGNEGLAKRAEQYTAETSALARPSFAPQPKAIDIFVSSTTHLQTIRRFIQELSQLNDAINTQIVKESGLQWDENMMLVNPEDGEMVEKLQGFEMKVREDNHLDQVLYEKLREFSHLIITVEPMLGNKYKFGQKEVALKEINGNLYAKIGGGWMLFEEFGRLYFITEFEKKTTDKGKKIVNKEKSHKLPIQAMRTFRMTLRAKNTK